MGSTSLVCVVIAVRNVAAYLDETLESLLAQTCRDWTAIVVDDGSTDTTPEVAARFADADPRITVVRQDWKGVSAARNHGIRRAESKWLLFLDGDDTVAPQHLERLLAFAAAHPDVDAVHCGWSRFLAGRRMFDEEYGPDRADMFEVLATRPAFVIHACLILRQVVIDAGCYDEHLTCCVDWDLWQRVAHRGTKFGFVREVLAFVRVRRGSVSSDASKLLSTGLRIIRRGHQERCLPGLAAAELTFCCWCSGVLLGEGKDPGDLLCEIPPGQDPGHGWVFLAKTLLHGFRFGSGLFGREIPILLRGNETRLRTFLQAVEQHVGAEGLAFAVETEVAECALKETPGALERIGTVQGAALELTTPLHDVRPESGVRRIVLHVYWRDSHVGEVTLPVVDGFLSRAIVADAVAAKFAWRILGQHFGETVYRARNMGKDLHDVAGWDVFLQELWGMPALKGEDFYRLSGRRVRKQLLSASKMPTLEISMEPTHWPLSIGEPAVVTLGGHPLGVMPSRFTRQVGTRGDWMAAITLWSGFELCQAAVRDFVIGGPTDNSSLRQRSRKQSARPPVLARDQLVFGRRLPSVMGTSASRCYALPGSAADDLKALALRHAESITQGGLSAISGSVLYVPGAMPADARGHMDEEESLSAHGTVAAQADRPPAHGAGQTSDHLPILNFHSVGPSGNGFDPMHISPDEFDAQIAFLKANEYYSVTLDQWRTAMFSRRPLPGNPIILTFDGGHLDFHHHAWPILKKHGFSAVVFIVTHSTHFPNSGSEAGRSESMSWRQMRELLAEGVEFGSGTSTHRFLRRLPFETAVKELAHSRLRLEEELGARVNSLAYPYGDKDECMEHFAGGCGYLYGLGMRDACSHFADSLLDLPRMNVRGAGTFEHLVSRFREQ